MEQLIGEVWQQLRKVSKLTFRSTSSAAVETGWVGFGEGIVKVEVPDDSIILFRESGTWQTPNGKRIAFQNIYRWRRFDKTISLEHLRFGEDSPVFLFLLEVAGLRKLQSSCPHVCSEDRYNAVLELAETIQVSWTVKGPNMSENIDYTYTIDDGAAG